MTSLPQDFTANYDGEVAEFWSTAFKEIPEQGSMIDLCTGNGAIALLAAEQVSKSGHLFEITAVDAAVMSPQVNC